MAQFIVRRVFQLDKLGKRKHNLSDNLPVLEKAMLPRPKMEKTWLD
jgi:hypothetical protein